MASSLLSPSPSLPLHHSHLDSFSSSSVMLHSPLSVSLLSLPSLHQSRIDVVSTCSSAPSANTSVLPFASPHHRLHVSIFIHFATCGCHYVVATIVSMVLSPSILSSSLYLFGVSCTSSLPSTCSSQDSHFISIISSSLPSHHHPSFHYHSHCIIVIIIIIR